MPWQLRNAKRRRRRHSEPRPIVEQLPRIEIADLCRLRVFPPMTDWHSRYSLEMPFKYPFLKNLVISLQTIEANHLSGYNQPIKLRWCRTGFGGNYRPRPLFLCNCGRSVTKLYFRYFNLACRRCTNALYASQACSKRLRPILRAQRMQAFLQFKTYMSKRNRQRLKARLHMSSGGQARIATAPRQAFKSKRLSHHAIPHPQHNYGTRGAMHWR